MTNLRSVPFELSTDRRDQATGVLNDWLPNLIDLAHCLKQAHWNLRGARFRSVHEHLDEILADVRAAVDDVAERAVTLGGQADGRPQAISAKSRLKEFPAGLLTVEQAIDASCTHLGAVIDVGRTAVAALSEVDPVSEDLAIGIVASLEKHAWMLDSQRQSDPVG